MDYTILNIIHLIYLYLKFIFIQMFKLYHKTGGSVPISLNNGATIPMKILLETTLTCICNAKHLLVF